MTLFVAGLSYKTAPVELREKLAVKGCQLASCARRLKLHGGLDEVVLLSTCNRIETYGITSGPVEDVGSMFRLLCPEPFDIRSHLYAHEHLDAVRHLFRVTAGLDSMLFGETEITGQIKNAYEIARAAGLTGGVLNRVFQRAFQVGKEVRTQTGIGLGATSVGGVAAELARQIFSRDFSRQSVLIIGAGTMGEACVRHLSRKGAGSILISNRSLDRANHLANEIGGRVVPFEECRTAIGDVDIVIASTSCAQTILTRQDVQKLMVRRRHRPLLLIDISVPRNIDPTVQGLNNVYLYDIDDLAGIGRERMRVREKELVLCDQIIEAQALKALEKLDFENKQLNQVRPLSQPSWLPRHAAVVLKATGFTRESETASVCFPQR